MGATTKTYAAITANNLNYLISGTGKFKKYKSMGPMGHVTLGHKFGIAQLPFMRMDPMIAMKQKDMFVSHFLK